MKIVYVYPQFAHLAGTERVLIDKMNYFSDMDGVEVFMVTYEQGAHPIVYHLAPKVLHIDLGVRFYPLYKYNSLIRYYMWYKNEKILQSRFDKLMADIMPDIVVATTYFGTVLSIINKCPVRFAKVLESHIDKRFLHCNDYVNLRNFSHMLRNVCDMKIIVRRVRKFDVLVALTDSDANDWSQFVKTRVISNVIHLNDSNHYCNLESKRVIFVGRYIYQKGIPDLFKIWKLVFERHPDWHLDMFGDGNIQMLPYKEEERLYLNIHVHKPDPNVFQRYLESSILVLTSLYEPFGLVMPEAMSCGLPVVAFDCPSGPATIITDGVDGFLIKNRDINQFADRVCQLIESIDLRRLMGCAAINSSKRYSVDQIIGQWIDLFHELVRTK